MHLPRLRHTLTLALLVCCPCWSPPAASADGREETIATYRGGEISREEFSSWLAYRGLEDDPATRLAEAQALALTKTLAAEGELAGAAERDYLELRIGHSQDRVLASAYRELVASRVEVSAEEIEEALRAAPEERFRRPREIELWNFFKRVPTKADAATRLALRREAELAWAALVDGESFSELAERSSDSSTASGGGYIGWIDPATLRPEAAAAAAELEAGQFSEVLETEDGFTILYCSDVRPEWTASPAERRAIVERELRQRRVAENWSEETEALRAAVDLEIDGEALRGSDPLATVATHSLGGFTLDQLRSFGPVDEMDEQDLRGKLERYLFHTVAAERARRLGIDERPDIRERLSWVRQASLARAQLEARARESGEDSGDELEKIVRQKQLERQLRSELIDALEVRLTPAD